MLFTDEIVIRAFVQGAITLPEALAVLDTGTNGAQPTETTTDDCEVATDD